MIETTNARGEMLERNKGEKIRTHLSRPVRKILDYLLISALEGGSNYWIHSASFPDKPEGEHAYEFLFRHSRAIIVRGDDEPDEPVRVGYSEAYAALVELERKFPKHMDWIAHENEDADTSDIWLQLACFGEVIYG